MNDYVRSPQLLDAGKSRVLIVDMQEKLLAAIPEVERLIGRCRLLADGAGTLDVPVSASEQYPQGLRPTVEPLREFVDTKPKLRFSAAEVVDWQDDATDPGSRHSVVVAGIETHICVQQTAFDLLAVGYDVHIAVDAVGSRFETDSRIALQRMRDSGCVLTTVEAVLFEWCEVAGTDRFKAISRLIRAASPSA